MKSKQIFLIMVAALVATLLITAGGVYFADSYLINQAKTIGDLRADDEVLTSALLRAQKTQDDLETYDYINDVATEVLPGVKNQSEVILILNSMASTVGINLNNYVFNSTEGNPGDQTQTEPLEGAPGILVFPINVTFEGTYSQIINWLEEAEKNRRKMQVANITIAPNDTGAAGRFFVDARVNAYVEK